MRNTKKDFNVPSVSCEVRTKNLPITSQEHHLHVSLFRLLLLMMMMMMMMMMMVVVVVLMVGLMMNFVHVLNMRRGLGASFFYLLLELRDTL
jgi:hypothetical protein